MNRISLTKAGKLIEMQSGGDDNPDLMEMRLNTLKQNALNSGYLEEDIEVRWVTDADYQVILSNQPKTVAELKQVINSECQRLIYAQFPAYYQANVANELYPDNGMKMWISAMIIESNRCTDLLDAAQEAVPVWPIYTEVG